MANPLCGVCRRRRADRRCDAPRCEVVLCPACAKTNGENIHHCPEHANGPDLREPAPGYTPPPREGLTLSGGAQLRLEGPALVLDFTEPAEPEARLWLPPKLSRRLVKKKDGVPAREPPGCDLGHSVRRQELCTHPFCWEAFCAGPGHAAHVCGRAACS